MRQSNRLPTILLAIVLGGCRARQKPSADVPGVAPSAATKTPLLPDSAVGRGAPAPSSSSVPKSPHAVPNEHAERARSDATPADTGRPPLGVACYAGFSPSAVPRVDVVRLGVSCGPSTGLTEFGHVTGAIEEGAPRGPTLRWQAGRGDCFRLFAVASDLVEDLEVEVRGPKGTPPSLTNQNRRWLIAGEEGPFCADRDGQFEAEFATRAGRGTLAAAVWRGAHMVGRRHAPAVNQDALGTPANQR